MSSLLTLLSSSPPPLSPANMIWGPSELALLGPPPCTLTWAPATDSTSLGVLSHKMGVTRIHRDCAGHI